jgi:hypothetical protein
MPRNSKDFQYDNALLLKDTGAVTATGNATVAAAARILDLGPSRVDGRVVVDVSAIDTASNDEGYTLQVQGSNSPSFANTVVALASKQLGDATVTGNSADTVVGRYEIPFQNEENGVLYRYLRLRFVVVGTTPSINCTAFVAPQVN